MVQLRDEPPLGDKGVLIAIAGLVLHPHRPRSRWICSRSADTALRSRDEDRYDAKLDLTHPEDVSPCRAATRCRSRGMRAAQERVRGMDSSVHAHDHRERGQQRQGAYRTRTGMLLAAPKAARRDAHRRTRRRFRPCRRAAHGGRPFCMFSSSALYAAVGRKRDV